MEHDLGAANVGLDRPDGAFDDQLDADRRGQVIDRVAQIDQFGHQVLVRHRIRIVMEVRQPLDPLYVLHRAGRKVVNDVNFVAAFEMRFGKMRSDEPGAACDQYLHSIFTSEKHPRSYTKGHEDTAGPCSSNPKKVSSSFSPISSLSYMAGNPGFG